MSIKDIIGQTITEIIGGEDSESITFELANGEKFIMEHHQACCESVSINAVNGDLRGLIGHVVEEADYATEELTEDCESGTKTVFTIRTPEQTVQITWHGYSNGYYGEGVSFYKEGGRQWGSRW